jgi:hypothetical protein
MTMIEQVLSKKAFAALEQIRRQRGIRSRTKALEIALLEIAEDDEPLSDEERKIIAERLQEVARGEVVPAHVVYAELDRLHQK